jgi:hypothetical protein
MRSFCVYFATDPVPADEAAAFSDHLYFPSDPSLNDICTA